MNIIGLEVSTSAAKCTLFSTKEGVKTTVEVPLPASVTDKITQEPAGIVASALQVLREVVQQANCKIDAIGLVGTWHSLLLLDKQRQPIGPIRTWADLSSTPSANRFRLEPDFVEMFYNKTGCMPHAMYPFFKFHHLRQTTPEVVEKACFLSSQIEYLFTELTGEVAVSQSNASGTGLFNIHTLDWDEELLTMLNLTRTNFSKLVEVFHTGGLRPDVARQVGLPSGTPVTVGTADGAMNQVAVGGAETGVMSFSVGTSGALRMVTPEPVLPREPSTWCYYLYNGKRIIGAATNATNNLDWFLGNVSQSAYGYDYFEQVLAIVDHQEAPFFMPFVYGERCPGWTESRPGGFIGIKPQHGLAEMYYAISEGILFNLFQCYEILIAEAGKPKRLLVSGGIMHSPFWLQLASDIFGRDLWTNGTKNDSTLGAIAVACESIGGRGDLYKQALSRKVSSPQLDTRTLIYRKRYARYLELYKGVPI